MLPGEARHGQRVGRPAVRALIRGATAAALLGAALAITGCGSDSEDDSAAPSPAQPTLEVSLDIDGPGGEAPRATAVSCGSQPGCAEAEMLSASDFAPVPAQTACTEIFGGPETATVSWVLDGERLEAELSRANGCEIDRFDRFIPLLTSLYPDYEPGASLRP